MFTGIIESTGTVRELAATPEGRRLTLEGIDFATELSLGESVAVNGVCLTVAQATTGDLAHFDLLQETLRVTNLGSLEAGSLVNLERAVAVGDRMSGHYVQGHVDCVSEILSITPDGNDHQVDIRLPEAFRHLVVQRGSISVSGISLTIAELREDAFTLWIIPHTMSVTHLQHAKSGDPINLEFDVLAKYVERMLAARGSIG
jgi:riboflavin synthase